MAVEGIELTWWELTGLFGASLYAASYLAAAFDKLPSQSIHYYMVKLIAAMMVLVSLTESFNLASVVIQVFFIAVSFIGIIRHVGRIRVDDASHMSGAASGSVVNLAQSDTAERNWRKRSDLG